ncbi:MAG: hypothetical protein QOJ94_2552 [Sphingomonadales bacterium]|jgi:hypothetical protein|nr:hypothetical protein [Sphingomonadales bacterium]
MSARHELGIALALMCGSCAPLSAGKPQFAHAMPLCEVVTNEQKFAGQRVTVRALLVPAPHHREIYGAECDRVVSLFGSSDLWDRSARRVVNAALAYDVHAEIPVVVSGVFQPWTRHENGQLIINVGGPYIEEGSIVAARQP